jgi:hypothetical protein
MIFAWESSIRAADGVPPLTNDPIERNRTWTFDTRSALGYRTPAQVAAQALAA